MPEPPPQRIVIQYASRRLTAAASRPSGHSVRVEADNFRDGHVPIAGIRHLLESE